MREQWCIENDFAAQRELAAREEARENELVRKMTEALRDCLKIMKEKAPEDCRGDLGNRVRVLIKKSKLGGV